MCAGPLLLAIQWCLSCHIIITALIKDYSAVRVYLASIRSGNPSQHGKPLSSSNKFIIEYLITMLRATLAKNIKLAQHARSFHPLAISLRQENIVFHPHTPTPSFTLGNVQLGVPVEIQTQLKDFGETLIGSLWDNLQSGLMLLKRTFQPSLIRRKRKHGFLARNATKDGRKILNNRRMKGRRSLCA